MSMPTTLALLTTAGGVAGAGGGGPRLAPSGADNTRPFAEWLVQARPAQAPAPEPVPTPPTPSREPVADAAREPERAPAARSEAPAPQRPRDDAERPTEQATARDSGTRAPAGDAPDAAQSRAREASRQRSRASDAQRAAVAAERPSEPGTDPAAPAEAAPADAAARDGTRRTDGTAEATLPSDATLAGGQPAVAVAVEPAPTADTAARRDAADLGAVPGIAPQPTGTGIRDQASDATADVSSAVTGTPIGGPATATSAPGADIGRPADRTAPTSDSPATAPVRADLKPLTPTAGASAGDGTAAVLAAEAVPGDRETERAPAPSPAGNRDRGVVRNREASVEGVRADLLSSAAAVLQRPALLPAVDAVGGSPKATPGLAAAGDSPRSGAEVTFAAPGLPPLPAGTPGTAASATAVYADIAASAVPVTTVAEPLDSPAFGPSLAAQVSVLARDGIERAEIRLNPADMGPVAVQILIDGTQARVEFTAEQAPTRAALEAGLPQLAAALRDAGLTLTGGGVFQNGQGRSRDGGDTLGRGRAGAPAGDRDGRRVGGAELDTAARSQPLRTAVAGRVDLYA
jgi:flagellar hook-length control protein FliK